MADPGSVLFNFQRQGLIMVAAAAGEDAVFEAAMEAGASDVQPAEGEDGGVAAFKARLPLRLLLPRRWELLPAAEACSPPPLPPAGTVRCSAGSPVGSCAPATHRVHPLSLPPRAPASTPATSQVLTAVEDYGAVSSALAEAGLPLQPEASGLVYSPMVQQEVDDAAFEANEALLERLLAVDDVDAVYTTVAGLE